MKRVRFGKTECMVSRIAFGGIPIMRLSREDAVRLVREALDLGINCIDTAHLYGDSEEKIGEAIRGMRRDELVLTSKSPAGDKKTFNAHLDLSLERLGVEYIDVYHLHNVGSKEQRDAILAPGGALEGLRDAVKSGKVRFPAFSSHSIPIAMELMKSGAFDVVQIPFNYIDHDAEKEIIPLARELDMGFLSMKPMGGGLLDNAGLSFRYLLRHEAIVPDPGMETGEELREIVGLVEENAPLTAEDEREIEKLRAEMGSSWCHRCDYCQPCPQDIPISRVLPMQSLLKRYPPDRALAMLGPAVEKAESCLACGDCMSRCPYHLEIPDLLKKCIAYYRERTAQA